MARIKKVDKKSTTKNYMEGIKMAISVEENNDIDESPQLSYGDIVKKILDLYASDTYKDLSKYYAKKDFFRLIGRARKEDTHSNVLAWLLDPAESHGLGIYPLKRFLQLLVYARSTFESNVTVKVKPINSLKADSAEVETKIVTNGFELFDVSVEREQAYSNDKDEANGRPDIVISASLKDLITEETCPLKIIVENKVGAKETDKQTERYYSWAIENCEPNDEILGFVYLKPMSNAELNLATGRACASDKFIQINYQYLSDMVLVPSLENMIDGDSKVFLNNYIRCLGYPEFNADEKEQIIMAIGTEEKTLLKKFWDDNKALLTIMGSVLKDDDDYNEEDKTTFSKLAETKSITGYIFNGIEYRKGSNNGFGKLALTIIKDYIEQHPSTLVELKKIFPDNIMANGVIAEAAKVEHKKFYPDTIPLTDGTVIAVNHEWTQPLLEKILNIVEKMDYWDKNNLQILR